ncbi:MAG: hypothetical protein IJ072_04700 [Oscillospiraceae bacterium]|nr:hypothetical protein [Oscillospiraceae bacterium]
MGNSKGKRAAELEKERKSKNQTRVMGIIIAVIVVVLLAVTLIINSKALKRNAAAVRINDESFSVAEYNYF